MRIYSFLNCVRITTTILFIHLSATSLLFAQELSLGSTLNRGYLREEKNLSGLQKQARNYRAQGLEFQRIGNLEAAMSLYQKAIELDPSYAVAYNDLGIIYETNGLIDRAEESYLESIKIDPTRLSAYTNLALLYENKRDLGKAAFYWQKRAELGSPDDPWTEKARLRLKDLRSVLSSRPFQDAREQEVVGLMKDVASQKILLKKDDKALSRHHFEKANKSYQKRDYATAIKEALDAQQLDPANTEISEFIERVQTRALSR